MKLLIVNGPNLDMLGRRDAAVYGSETLEEINAAVTALCKELGVTPQFVQSNSEGALIDALHAAVDKVDGVVINAGAYTHYSHAIGDALELLHCPKIEVHLSNVQAREDFRHTSVLARSCTGVIGGFGKDSYLLAVRQIAGKA